MRPPRATDIPKSPGNPPEQLAAFVTNNVRVTCELPYEMIPDHFLRRASASEIKFVRGVLQKWGGWQDRSFPYESTRTRGSNGGFKRSLDPSEWRYWVLDVRATNAAANDRAFQAERASGVFDIERASRLTGVEMYFNVHLSAEGTVTFRGWDWSDWLSGIDPSPQRL